MNNTFVSLIIPIFNPPESAFDELLNSLQSFQKTPVEVLLVDDGSDPWVREYIENRNLPPWFYYIRKKNGGVSSARNMGMQLAKGKYICFCDADDIFFADAFEEAIQSIDDSQLLVLFDYVLNDKKNKKIQEIQLFDSTGEYPISKLYEIIAETSKANVAIGKLFNRRKIFKENLFFDTSMKQGEDIVFTIKYIDGLNKFYYIHKSIYCYEWDITTTTNRFLKDPKARLYDNYCSYREKCGLLSSNEELLEACGARFINELGSRTIFMMQHGILNPDIKCKILEYYKKTNFKITRSSNFRIKIYNILFKYRLWIGFYIISRLHNFTMKK